MRMKMKKRTSRSQQKQINILHTTTKQRNSRAQVTHIGFWAAVILAMLAVVGVALHYSVGLLLDHVLYHNPRYVLKRIDIEPGMGHFSKYPICQATGLALGENMWALNLPQITHDLEKLAYVSSAQVERRFPDTLVIKIHERTPVVRSWESMRTWADGRRSTWIAIASCCSRGRTSRRRCGRCRK